MSETKHTPGPWSVRELRNWGGELVDCFVTAKDVNGLAYGAEILGDDEYREESGGLQRKLADARLIASAPDMLEALRYYAAIKGPMGEPARQAIAKIAAQ